MVARPYRIFEVPEVLAVLREADPAVLRALAREVYPALRAEGLRVDWRLLRDGFNAVSSSEESTGLNVARVGVSLVSEHAASNHAPMSRQRLRFTGWITGFGTASGLRLVIGRSPSSWLPSTPSTGPSHHGHDPPARPPLARPG